LLHCRYHFADWVFEMNLTTLFFNAMRMTNKIDCRRFAVDPAYQQALEHELCRGVAREQQVRKVGADSAATGALSPAA